MQKNEWDVSRCLVWLDCEMSGLDVAHDVILEIGLKTSDMAASKVLEGPSYVLKASDAVLSGMDAWCLATHTANGLIEASRQSSWTAESVEEALLAWLLSLGCREYYLAGNSIWCDRRFLFRYMPRLERLFHYRMLDVSALKLVYRDVLAQPYVVAKQDTHRVMVDVDQSIEEYRYYLGKMAS